MSDGLLRSIVLSRALANTRPDDFVQENHTLAIIYCVLAAICVAALVTRTFTACFCGLPLTLTHILFLVLVLILIGLRIVSGYWDPSEDVIKHGSKTSGLVYDVVNTIPLIMFLSIFLVLLYHVTTVLHSINLAYESTLRSLAPGHNLPESPRISTRCVYCQGIHFLGTFRWVLIIVNAAMWLLVIVGYVVNFKWGDKHMWGNLFSDMIQVPVFAICAITGTCFLIVSIQLLRRLVRLQKVTQDGRGEDAETSRAVAQVRGAFGEGVSAIPNSLVSPRSSLKAGTSGDPSPPVSLVLQDVAGAGKAPRASEQSSGTTAPEQKTTPTHSALVNSSRFQSRANRESRVSIRSSVSWASERWSSRSSPIPSSDLLSLAPPNVAPVVSMVRRILIIVSVCMLSFLYRAACIMYLFQWHNDTWPAGLLVPYYLFSEVMPVILLLFLYLLPGLEAIWFSCNSNNKGVYSSVIEGHAASRSTVTAGASYYASGSQTPSSQGLVISREVSRE